jgi:hypothetical protein
MTGLNSFVLTMTGPKRMRSALRQRTAAIQALIDALDSPAELRMTIPAAVFGGDIFALMSQQMREGLAFAPPQDPTVWKPHRQRTLRSVEGAGDQHARNSFSVLSQWLKQPMRPDDLRHEDLTRGSTPETSDESIAPRQATSGSSSQGPQASRLHGGAENLLRSRAGETPAVPGKSTTGSASASSVQRQAAAEPALLNSLKRYWESIRERRDSNHARQPTALGESLSNALDVPLAVFEKSAASSRAWPEFIGRDLSDKPRSFDGGPPNLAAKAARMGSSPDHQIQNVFNIEVNNANHAASNYDDLGERIAQILHEQAMQHGIDVT